MLYILLCFVHLLQWECGISGAIGTRHCPKGPRSDGSNVWEKCKLFKRTSQLSSEPEETHKVIVKIAHVDSKGQL